MVRHVAARVTATSAALREEFIGGLSAGSILGLAANEDAVPLDASLVGMESALPLGPHWEHLLDGKTRDEDAPPRHAHAVSHRWWNVNTSLALAFATRWHWRRILVREAEYAPRGSRLPDVRRLLPANSVPDMGVCRCAYPQ